MKEAEEARRRLEEERAASALAAAQAASRDVEDQLRATVSEQEGSIAALTRERDSAAARCQALEAENSKLLERIQARGRRRRLSVSFFPSGVNRVLPLRSFFATPPSVLAHRSQPISTKAHRATSIGALAHVVCVRRSSASLQILEGANQELEARAKRAEAQAAKTATLIRQQSAAGAAASPVRMPLTPVNSALTPTREGSSEGAAAGAAAPAGAVAAASTAVVAAGGGYGDFSYEEVQRQKAKMQVERMHGDPDVLLKCLQEEVGFSRGRPTAACLVFRALLQWHSFEAERTNLFDRIIHTMGVAIETDTENNAVLAYWLSNTTTLLYLLQRTLRTTGGGAAGAAAARRRNPQTLSVMERMKRMVQTSPSDLEAEKPREGVKGVPQVDAKYPALLFKQQLTAFVEKIYGAPYSFCVVECWVRCSAFFPS